MVRHNYFRRISFIFIDEGYKHFYCPKNLKSIFTILALFESSDFTAYHKNKYFKIILIILTLAWLCMTHLGFPVVPDWIEPKVNDHDICFSWHMLALTLVKSEQHLFGAMFMILRLSSFSYSSTFMFMTSLHCKDELIFLKQKYNNVFDFLNNLNLFKFVAMFFTIL